MTTTCKYCERCRQRAVCWPATMTVMGQMDLCSPCYWHYAHVISQVALFFGVESRPRVPDDFEQQPNKPR